MIRAGTPMDNTDPVITALKREARRLMLRGRVRAYLAFLSRKITNTQRPRS